MPKSITKIGICGAAGRMGRALIHAVVTREDVKLAAAIERAGNTLIGADAGEMAALAHLNVALNSSLASQIDLVKKAKALSSVQQGFLKKKNSF